MDRKPPKASNFRGDLLLDLLWWFFAVAVVLLSFASIGATILLVATLVLLE